MAAKKRPDPAKKSSAVSPRMVGLAAFAIVALGLGWRRPDQWFAPQFWAEDGCIFFSDAATHGWGAFLKPYGGYLSTVQRIIAGAASPLPWEYLPLVYMLVAGLMVALVGVRLASARLPLLERILATVALVAVPHSGEVFLNITNLQWTLNALLVVNLLEAAPETKAEMRRRAGELLLVGLSTPMGIVLAPFAALWGWRWRESRLAWPLLGAWLIPIVIQSACFFASERPVGGAFGSILFSLPVAVARFFFTLFLGNWVSFSTGLGWTVAGGGLLSLAWLFSDRTNGRRRFGLLLLFAVGLSLVAGRMAVTDWTHPYFWHSRYTYFPLVLSLWTLASLAAGTCRWPHRCLAGTLFALVVWSAASTWVARPLGERYWVQQVREAKAGTRTHFEVAPNIVFPVPPLPGARP